MAKEEHVLPTSTTQARRNRHSASAIAKMGRAAVEFAGKPVGDCVHAACRITLANRWGLNNVYWYGNETALVLAEQDLTLIYREADRLLATLKELDFEPEPEQEKSWHGQDDEDCIDDDQPE